MNDAQQTPQGLFNFMEKLQLRLVLEKDLNSHGIHKLHKI
jgi:hypothetical protein